MRPTAPRRDTMPGGVPSTQTPGGQPRVGPRDPRPWLGIALALAAILAVAVATYHRGPGSYARINDYLDSFLPVTTLLVEEPVIGGLHDRVEEPLGGVPRNSLRTTLHLGMAPYYLLPPIYALAWNETVARIVAFAGLLLLLRRRLLPDGPRAVQVGAALCFALLPVFPPAYLSVAAQPLLLLALLDIRDRRAGPWQWGVVALFPLYSTLAYIGPFVLLGVGALASWELLRHRRISWALVSAGALIAVLYAASEYRLLYQTLVQTDYVSYRTEWDHRGRSLLGSLLNGVDQVLFSQNHAAAVQFPFLLATALGTLGLETWRRGSLGAPLSALRSERGAYAGLVWTLLLCGIIGALYAVYRWDVIQDLIAATGVRALRMFGFHRFQWFHPLLYGLAFAFALTLLWRRGRAGRVLAAAALVVQGGWALWWNDAPRVAREVGLTYREFYSPELFREIQEAIPADPSEYRVATFALIPGIALYNGFQTVGGLLSNYPLEYKHRFREVIAEELPRDDWLRRQYDDWGAHVHLYSAELGMIIGYRKGGLWTRHQPVQAVRRLEMDTEALADLGARYVLSAVDIGNHAELGLVLEDVFERDDSPWRIRLYSLSPARRPDS